MDAATAWGTALEKRKQLRANAKLAEQAVKNNPELLERIGTDEDGFAMLSAPEKVQLYMGAVAGFAEQQRREKEKMEMEEAREQIAARKRFRSGVAPTASGAGAMQFLQPSAQVPLQNRKVNARDPEALFEHGVQSGLDPREIYEMGLAARSMRKGFNPGTVMDLPGVPGHRFVVQSPDGGGSVVPVGAAAGSRRTPEQNEADASRAHYYDTAPMRQELSTIDQRMKELAKVRTELRGKKRTDAVIEQINDVLSQEKSLSRRRAEIEKGIRRTKGAGARAAEEESEASAGDPEAVKAAFKAGKISKEEALKKLREMGFK